jgi:hypothetical protein
MRALHVSFLVSGWLDLPLEIYLADIPPNKHIVMGNYRSAQSNTFFIRNSVEGRALAVDWLAIAMSGYIQCHGFDQVKPTDH